MSTITAHPRQKTAKHTSKPRYATKSTSDSALRGRLLTGQELLEDMEAYRKEVSATPESARNFLTRLGVMTAGGKAKKLIRG